MPRRLFLLVLALTLAAVAAAAVYKWVDEKGVTHYSDAPPAGKKFDELKLPASPPPRGLVGPRGSLDLLAAIERGDDDRVIALLQSGADPNSQDPLGRTALMYAGINGQTRLMKLLIAKGADVNAVAQGFNRVTPLIASVIFGDPDAIRVLLEHGADASARDSQGWTALTWAESRYKTAPDDRSILPHMPERNPHGDLAFATRKEFKEVMALLERAAAER